MRRLLCALCVLHAAVACSQPEERFCAEADGPLPAGDAFKRACVVPEADGQHVLRLTRRSGAAVDLDRVMPVFPWAKLTLVPAGRKQWLVVVYYADVDRDDGKTNFAMIYDLDSKAPVLSGYSARVTLEDYDRDGARDLVLYTTTARTGYAIQVGWPQVYELGAHVELKPLEDYPKVVESFIEETTERIAHLKDVCEGLGQSGPSCPHSEDIALLQSEIAVAHAVRAGR